MRSRSLNRVLRYENPEVVASFMERYGVSKRAANVVFKDMLRFLWLSQKINSPGATSRAGAIPRQSDIWVHMLIIDEMWHTFVLYTREYSDFSHKYFGQYVHHEPERVLPAKGHRRARNQEPKSGSREEFEVFIDYVWRELGPATARRWFHDFPKDYSPLEIYGRQYKSAKKRLSKPL